MGLDVYSYMKLACFFLSSVMLVQASERLLSDQSSPTIVFRRIAVAANTFDEQYVIQRCRNFLSSEDKKLTVLTLVPDQPNATTGASVAIIASLTRFG